MIRFRIIGGGYLELPDIFEFQFAFNNSLFSFDNMKVNRTTEFQIPATPNNNLLFNFSNEPSADGTYLRTSKPAQLFYDGGVINGTLFIGKYSGGSYSAIFVYGELTKLKDIKDKGAIRNYCSFTNEILIDDAYIVNGCAANGVLPYNFRFYKYQNGIADVDKLTTIINMLPTVKLSYLTAEAASALGVSVDFTGLTGYNSIGLILNDNKANPTPETVTASGITKSTLALTGGSGYFDTGTVTFKYKPLNTIFWKNQDVKVFVCKQDLTIKFNSNYGFFGVVGNSSTNFLTTAANAKSFPSIVSGTEIQLKKDEYFTFVNLLDYFLQEPIDDFDTNISLSFDVWSGDAGSADVGETYPLQANLPDITFVDLLKIYATLFKCGIEFNPVTSVFSFFKFDFDKSTAVDIDSILVAEKSVDRTFLDYARKNTVNFKSEEYVTTPYFLQYNIQNANIADEKSLITIPFSDGVLSTNSDVLVHDFETVDPFAKKGKEITIAVCSKTSGQNYLKHISQLYQNFTVDDNLTSLIANSTTVEVTIKQSDAVFLKIKNNNVYKYRGKHYICINGTHSGNTSDLTLIKI